MSANHASCVIELLNFQQALPLVLSFTGHNFINIQKWPDSIDGIISTVSIVSWRLSGMRKNPAFFI